MLLKKKKRKRKERKKERKNHQKLVRNTYVPCIDFSHHQTLNNCQNIYLQSSILYSKTKSAHSVLDRGQRPRQPHVRKWFFWTCKPPNDFHDFFASLQQPFAKLHHNSTLFFFCNFNNEERKKSTFFSAHLNKNYYFLYYLRSEAAAAFIVSIFREFIFSSRNIDFFWCHEPWPCHTVIDFSIFIDQIKS